MTESNELPASDPLRAIPIITEFTEVRYDSKGCAQLMMVPPDSRGFKGFIQRKLKLKKSVRVDLDEVGTSFWNMIDGKTKLKEMEKKLRKKFGFKKGQSTEAVISFVKDLMLRGMIVLKLPELQGVARGESRGTSE